MKVFGRLIVVLVASSVPVNAGCGRPGSRRVVQQDSARGSRSDSCESVCARALLDLVHDRIGILFDLRLIRQHIAGVVRHRRAGVDFLQAAYRTTSSRPATARRSCPAPVWRPHSIWSMLGFVERLHVDALDLERRTAGRALPRSRRVGWKRVAIKITAKRAVQRERNDQADEEPIALLAP